MAFIKMATRFGTQSFYSNGQLIGLTCPNAYGMGSITYAPFEASPVERTMEHQDGTASHFDRQGHMTGTSYQDQLGNSHFLGSDGHAIHSYDTLLGVNMCDDHGLVKSIIGESGLAHELAKAYMSGKIEFSQDLSDIII
ncbi:MULTISPECIES: hypothetical protein [Aeromonas]|uniref:Uncharacterized protein n=1 Tax=Aeromonas veronii AMC34 TaxID=1073383 RepID=K1II31_AERVE|nr:MULTISPECIES: hypothetical protein [Aeromonas]EKB17886.1 hypothetical protein HMPREF1168_04113 [Aeromonas veronii AMC34]QOK18546.1 hypothetical protein IL332_16325 [Aeromonas caviae]